MRAHQTAARTRRPAALAAPPQPHRSPTSAPPAAPRFAVQVGPEDVAAPRRHEALRAAQLRFAPLTMPHRSPCHTPHHATRPPHGTHTSPRHTLLPTAHTHTHPQASSASSSASSAGSSARPPAPRPTSATPSTAGTSAACLPPWRSRPRPCADEAVREAAPAGVPPVSARRATPPPCQRGLLLPHLSVTALFSRYRRRPIPRCLARPSTFGRNRATRL